MFYGGNFMFNNQANDEFDVFLVSESSNVLNEYGIRYSREVQKVNSIVYSQSEGNVENITLSITSNDRWTSEKINSVMSWLVQDNFCEFISEDDGDVVYYFKCVKVTKRLNADMYGIIDFEMMPMSCYGYTRRQSTIKSVEVTGFVDIFNQGSLEEAYKPIMKVAANSNNDINIFCNEKEFIITNVENGKVYTIDNQLGTIRDNDNKNHIAYCNRNFISLKKGANRIDITGNCRLEVITQFPIMI